MISELESAVARVDPSGLTAIPRGHPVCPPCETSVDPAGSITFNVPASSVTAIHRLAGLTATAGGSPDGTSIPALTNWTDPTGLVYQQTAAAVIAGGVATITVKCLTPGASGNQANGTVITLVAPISGVNSTATVASTVATGVDRESVSSWRSQVMIRIAYRPQGGAVPDYIIWGLEVPGIIFAVVGQPGGGVVNVYGLQSLTGISRVPGAPLIATLQAYLRDQSRKIIGANVFALTTTERTCAVTITGAAINGSGLTTDQKNQVVAAVTASLYAAYPRQYSDQANPTDTIDVGMVWDALRAIGATATAVTINVSGIGGGPYVLPIGEIVAPGVFTWA